MTNFLSQHLLVVRSDSGSLLGADSAVKAQIRNRLGSREEAKGKNRLYIRPVLEAAISEALVTVVFSVLEQVYLFLGTEEVTEAHFSMSHPWCEVQVGLPSGSLLLLLHQTTFPRDTSTPITPGPASTLWVCTVPGGI